jgi:hypothetical protein
VPPLIVTLRLDAEAETWLEALRRAHFPPARNLVPAHVTLFHALPGAEERAVRTALAEGAAATPVAGVVIGPPHFTGRGVALAVQASAVAGLRATLAARFALWLTPQDRQGWRGHVTVQNKVPPEVARALHAELAASLPPRHAHATGLRLWHYLGGPWEAAGEFGFAGPFA